ncbi:ankyrin repeat and SOCS box protein 2-like [Cololabis saira]|uniref:ankyrin repeat and SOCS box protein 2-like n=1 Tax=Cololabis saira TaxID=129043 RepID=UPI002AD3DF6D|nr:ankyrin repeat and SOCS box protein 2-like [Cololabis saira]
MDLHRPRWTCRTTAYVHLDPAELSWISCRSSFQLWLNPFRLLTSDGLSRERQFPPDETGKRAHRGASWSSTTTIYNYGEHVDCQECSLLIGCSEFIMSDSEPEDFSVYSQLSEEELLHVILERSFSDKQKDSEQRHADPGPGPDPGPSPGPPRQQRRVPPAQSQQNCANPPTALSQFLYKGFKREFSPLQTFIMNGDTEALMELVQQKPWCLTEPNPEGWVAIHEAVFYGQLECVRILIRANPGSVDRCTPENETPLHIAVRENLSLVDFLLRHGANVNAASKCLETPLFAACEHMEEDIVELLLKSGAQVNRLYSQGGNIIHEACRHGSVNICKMLLDAGADMNARNMYGIQPFFIAAQHGHAGIINLLAQRGADINGQAGDGASPLYEASKNGHIPAVMELLQLKADANRANKSGLLPLHVAVRNNHPRIVSLLIPVTSRTRVRRCGLSPLHIAAERNRDTIMELLIESGFDVNAKLSDERSRMYVDKRSTVLYTTVYNGNFEAAEMLLEAGANPNLDIFNPLLIAARFGWVDMAELLVRYGADVNARMSTQPSLFPAAILLGMQSLRMLKLLLDHGCDARLCFDCLYGQKPHPPARPQRRPIEHLQSHDDSLSKHCIQYCEAISTCRMSGPITKMLLDYVGHIRLCSRLLAILEGLSEWADIKLKAYPPHPLMQLCRLKIRQLLGIRRLRHLHTLPIPSRLIRFLQYDVRGFLS